MSRLFAEMGVTGTRTGATPAQFEQIKIQLELVQPYRFHHGDCIGVDIEAAWLARVGGAYIIGHPPTDPKHRAYFDSDEEWHEAPYLERNHDIVDTVELLLVVPLTPDERLRSGTWATYRYAVDQSLDICRIFPDGSIDDGYDLSRSV